MSTPRFVSREPRLEDYWRGIVLFGRNVASYKFALAKTLLDLKPTPGTLVKLEELAIPFSAHICEHLRAASKQGTFSRSQFLEACKKMISGESSQSELIEATVRYGFINVIDAFHVVGAGEVPRRFFKDERSSNRGIRVTDSFGELLGGQHSMSLSHEAESRWKLVETAWELGVSRNLLSIQHDNVSDELFALANGRRRKNVTSSRGALNGYQKGKCFYCFETLKLEGGEPPDVDHFFPHLLQSAGLVKGLDGVWNLVLACKRCNRGAGGKFEGVPSVALLERLHRRNEYLIMSHHPLRETILAQTGKSEGERVSFLKEIHNTTRSRLFHVWEPKVLVDGQF